MISLGFGVILLNAISTLWVIRIVYRVVFRVILSFTYVKYAREDGFFEMVMIARRGSFKRD